MARKEMTNNQANESVSKFKMLSAYGGPGSLVHTSYGSILISCIEEWGFIQRLAELQERAADLREETEFDYVEKNARYDGILLSNDERLLTELKRYKNLVNLRYLALIPDIEVNDYNQVKEGKATLAINSVFMPKGFFDNNHRYKAYKDWLKDWPHHESNFFPPQFVASIDSKATGKSYQITLPLKQDNLVLICKNGHLSDFPWSKFLRWRIDSPLELNKEVNLFSVQNCCLTPEIQITETLANTSGFDGKWIKCTSTGCPCGTGTSLKGIMSLKVVCPGHKPWEVETGSSSSYYGKTDARNSLPRAEQCDSRELKVALTTGNNLYFSRSLSSIYMPGELFLDDITLKLRSLEKDLERAKNDNDFETCIAIKNEMKMLEKEEGSVDSSDHVPDSEKDNIFRFQEFKVLSTKGDIEISVDKEGLLVKDVTKNLCEDLSKYFQRVLRIDTLKLTSAQLDFSRVEPYDADSTGIQLKNIFRSRPENILAYPVVENYGEGIFFAFNESLVTDFSLMADFHRFGHLITRERNEFARPAISVASNKGWQLYLIHSFCHIIMRELEFRCGYPTASLSERLYVCNETETKMYGCLIFTAEGAEGSMGGLIAQTREDNLNTLLKNALSRATICNSDPLCWQSEGQGLFELNLSACFSCSLVSETSCEHRNIYLDRQILIDSEHGFFKDVINNL